MEDTESTTTSADADDNLCDNPTRDTLAEGILGLLKPTIDQLDDRVRATRISQIELKQQIEGLSEELRRVSAALQTHPDAAPHVQALLACKHRVTVVLNILQTAHERLNEIRHMVSAEEGVRKTTLSSPETQPEPSGSVVTAHGSINS